jgi:hypothetical protein
MTPGRNTTTGRVLENMVLPALAHGGYTYWKPRGPIGERIGGGKHYVDLIASKDEKKYLISLKWQQVSGTAEQKIPYEVICLADAVDKGNYERAYLVLGGPGWKLRNFYVSGGLDRYLKNTEKVKILTLEDFVAKANKGEL